MPLTRSLHRPVTRDLTRQFGGPVGDCRNLTKLVAANSKHYTIPSITANDSGFDIYFKFTAAAAPSGAQIIIGSDVADVYIGVLNTGKLRFWYGASVVSTSVVCDGDEHSIRCSRSVGGNSQIAIDGVLEKNIPTVSDVFNIEAIGRHYNNTLYLDGYVSDVEIHNLSVLARKYDITETWGTSQLTDSSGNAQHGTAVNITGADAEQFCLNTSTTPHQRENGDSSVIIPLAY